MQYLLDYIASSILGTALLMIMVRSQDTAAETQSLYHGDALVQEMLVQTSYLLQGELRNMGVGVPENSRTVMHADTATITFLYDIDRNGVPDTVRYTAGTPDDLLETPNELDRPLRRSVNGSGSLVVGSVTQFHLRYLTRDGVVLSSPVDPTRLSEIYSIEITMEVQNPFAMMRTEGTVASGERVALYSSSIWQQTRLASQNTRR